MGISRQVNNLIPVTGGPDCIQGWVKKSATPRFNHTISLSFQSLINNHKRKGFKKHKIYNLLFN